MNNFFLIFLLLNCIFFTGCNQANHALDSELQTIRLANIDENNSVAGYLVKKVRLSDASGQSGPVIMAVKDQKIVQGMIKTGESKDELRILAERLKNRYGREFILKPVLNLPLKISLFVNDKLLREFQIMNGNINLPFQFMAENTGSTMFKVRLDFSGGNNVKKASKNIQTMSSQQKEVLSNSSGTMISASSEKKESSAFSASSESADELSFEQIFEF